MLISQKLLIRYGVWVDLQAQKNWVRYFWKPLKLSQSCLDNRFQRVLLVNQSSERETLYSKVSNRRVVWNSRGGWKKYQKLTVGGWKKLKVLIAWGGGGGGEEWLLNCFFLSFSNLENYSIKNICVYSKSKIKTKVTSKQNLEHFKMVNRWAIFIRALAFSSSPRANFSLFEYLCFSFLLSFRFILT